MTLQLSPVTLTGLVAPELIQLIEYLSDIVGVLTVTSLYRKGDRGVHGTRPCRGIDVRCRNKTIGKAYANTINLRWIYDPDRPHLKCAVFHDAGTGYHLHLQVHQNTVRAEKTHG
jgi:hypothetical protein